MNIKITVGGVPWESLTAEHKRRIIKRNTNLVAEIITKEVSKMAEEGKTINEIKQFLGLTKEN